MRHGLISLLAASAFLACGAAAVAQTVSPPADISATAAPAPEPMVCVDQDSGGNSRLGSARKVCHTQKEWDALPRARR
jgi:hypothetical protein